MKIKAWLFYMAWVIPVVALWASPPRILKYSELQSLETRLKQSVFEAEYQVLNSAPFRGQLKVDGAVVVIEYLGKVHFMSTARWLSKDQIIDVHLDGQRIEPFKVMRVDFNLDLAELEPLNAQVWRQVRALRLAPEQQPWPLQLYSLNKGHLLPCQGEARKVHEFYVHLFMPMINGYPVVDASGQLWALSSQRRSLQPPHVLGVDRIFIQTFWRSSQKSKPRH